MTAQREGEGARGGKKNIEDGQKGRRTAVLVGGEREEKKREKGRGDNRISEEESKGNKNHFEMKMKAMVNEVLASETFTFRRLLMLEFVGKILYLEEQREYSGCCQRIFPFFLEYQSRVSVT